MELEQIKKLNEAINKLGETATAAQEAATRAETKADGMDACLKETVKKASEEATKALEDANKIKAQVEAVEKTAEYMEKLISRMPGSGDSGLDKEMEAKASDETARYLKTGAAISDQVNEYVVRGMLSKSLHGVTDSHKENQVKTLIAGVDPAGGYFIRPERSATMIKRIFETSPVRQVANIETTTSDVLEILVDDQESASGGWVGELTARPETATPRIGKLSIPVHEQFSQPAATQKMLDDAGFDIEAWLSNKVTSRMSRFENTAFVTGDGSQKPQGFLSLPNWTAPGVYERFALEQIPSQSATDFTGDGIKAIKNSVIEEYQANAVFAIQRASFESIITLKDGQGRYLLDTRSFKEGDTMVLLGKRVIFMTDIPAIAASALALVYGDFSMGYTVVDRMGFRVIRDNLTNKPNVLFYTTKRTGGAVSNYESLKIQVISV